MGTPRTSMKKKYQWANVHPPHLQGDSDSGLDWHRSVNSSEGSKSQLWFTERGYHVGPSMNIGGRFHSPANEMVAGQLNEHIRQPRVTWVLLRLKDLCSPVRTARADIRVRWA
jgi:hypothetical protein